MVPRHPKFSFPITQHRVIDGDSVEVTIDRGWNDKKLFNVRLEGIDAAEHVRTRGPVNWLAAEAAVRFAKNWLLSRNDGRDVRCFAADKGKYFGRMIGDLYIAGDEANSLGSLLFRHGLVKKYKGGKRQWAASDLDAIVKKAVVIGLYSQSFAEKTVKIWSGS